MIQNKGLSSEGLETYRGDSCIAVLYLSITVCVHACVCVFIEGWGGDLHCHYLFGDGVQG